MTGVAMMHEAAISVPHWIADERVIGEYLPSQGWVEKSRLGDSSGSRQWF
jgi:hypothetical protein